MFSAPFSAALCRGLIEARVPRAIWWEMSAFSAALCRGLIEAGGNQRALLPYQRFSAALCRGLIEATKVHSTRPRPRRFPRLYAAASLKRRHGYTPQRALESFSAALCRGLIEAGKAQA